MLPPEYSETNPVSKTDPSTKRSGQFVALAQCATAVRARRRAGYIVSMRRLVSTVVGSLCSLAYQTRLAACTASATHTKRARSMRQRRSQRHANQIAKNCSACTPQWLRRLAPASKAITASTASPAHSRPIIQAENAGAVSSSACGAAVGASRAQPQHSAIANSAGDHSRSWFATNAMMK